MSNIEQLDNINVEEACRACLKPCEHYKMLYESDENIDQKSWGDVFSDVVKIDIKANIDSSPNRICNTCTEVLQSAYTFIQKSQQNHQRLLEYLKISCMKQPDCLSEYPIDIPIEGNFFEIKVENESMSEYTEALPESKISPPHSTYSEGSDCDYEGPPLKQQKSEEKANKMQCNYCNRVFKRLDFLESHKKKHEEQLKTDEVSTEDNSLNLNDESSSSKLAMPYAPSTASYYHETDGVFSSDAINSAKTSNQRINYLSEDEEVNKKRFEDQLNNIINCAASQSSSSLENSSNNIIFSRRFFTIVKQLNCTEFQKKRKGILAECWTCKSRLQGSTQITSNFIRHLRMKHPHKFAEYELVKNKIHRNKSTAQEQFNVLVVKFLTNNMLPIRIVEDKTFRDLVRFANSDLNVMNRPTASNLIDKMYSSMVDKIKAIIAKNKNFCTTADVWSIRQHTFIGFTCHWLDENFQRKSLAFSCKRFHGSHSYDRMHNMLQETYSEFGLNGVKIVATVTDNGTNLLEAFREFGIESNTTGMELLESSDDEELQSLQFKNTFLENVLPNHVRCASYYLNLIASTDVTRILKQHSSIFTMHKSVMQKCSNLWSKVKRPTTSEQIISILGSQLKYPVATQWNSLFESVKEIISHKSECGKLCKILEIPMIVEEDFVYLEDYVQLLSPISEALDFLQNHMIYGYLLPTLATIRSKFRKILINNSLKLLDSIIISKLDETLANRFHNYFNLTGEACDAIIASVLCPSVKLKWVPALNPSFNDEKIVEISAIVRNAIETEYNLNTDLGQKESPNELSDVAYFDFFINEEQSETTSTSINNSIGSAGNEYFAYLANPSTSMDMLNRYPTLKATFLKYNTPLPSSAAVERLFSFAWFMNIPRRGVLSDVNFEKMLLLKANSIEENKIFSLSASNC